MNDIQINHMLRILRPTFKGVYAKDDVLPVKIFPSSMIVNESDWGLGVRIGWQYILINMGTVSSLIPMVKYLFLVLCDIF